MSTIYDSSWWHIEKTKHIHQLFFLILICRLPCNFKAYPLKSSQREKCPNTELFLVRIFPHSDWIRRDASYLSVFSPNAGKADQNNSEYGQFLRSDGLQRNIRPISYCLFIGKTLNVLFTMRCLNFLLKIIWFSKTNQNLDLTRLIPDLCCEFWKKCFG